MGSLEMELLSTDVALFLFKFKIQRGNEGNVCLVVCMPQSMSFHQNPPIFSGRVICRHSQKQLTQLGFVNASCLCLFVLGTVQIWFVGFLVKLGLLIPESWSCLWAWGCWLEPGYFAVRHHWGGRWANLSLDTKRGKRGEGCSSLEWLRCFSSSS